MAETAAHLVDHVFSAAAGAPMGPVAAETPALLPQVQSGCSDGGRADPVAGDPTGAGQALPRCAGQCPSRRRQLHSPLRRCAHKHIHFHCCVIYSLFFLDDGELRICERPALGQADIAAIQTRVSQRMLRWFVRRGWLDADEARAMRDWHNDGSFSLDAAVRIP